MTRIYISLGSNIDRERHIRAGLDALHAEFGELQVSRVFESEAVGFNGRPFYNLVVGAWTELPLATLCQRLRAMEFAHGREPDAKKFAPRTLDLDLLLYADLVRDDAWLTLPHPRLQERAFVLYPLHDIAPGLQLPGGGILSELLLKCPPQGLERLDSPAAAGTINPSVPTP